jgi:hypothetical protein
VAVALDDDTGSATDVLVAVAVAVAVDVTVAAPASAVALRALEVDSAFNMSVTCTKKNPSTTGNSLDSREFSVLCGLPVFSDLP